MSDTMVKLISLPSTYLEEQSLTMKARNGSQFKIPLVHKYWLPDLHHYEVNTLAESKKKKAPAEDRLGCLQAHPFPATKKNAVA